MLDLVDSLLVILDLCFALICTPIGELYLHHFVFYCSISGWIGSVHLSEPASLHPCNMSPDVGASLLVLCRLPACLCGS